jgi:hypothetical protein
LIFILETMSSGYESTPPKRSRQQNEFIFRNEKRANPLLKTVSELDQKLIVGGYQMLLDDDENKALREWRRKRHGDCIDEIIGDREDKLIKNNLAKGMYKKPELIKKFAKLLKTEKFTDYYNKINFRDYERIVTAMDLFYGTGSLNIRKWQMRTTKRQARPIAGSYHSTPKWPKQYGEFRSLERALMSQEYQHNPAEWTAHEWEDEDLMNRYDMDTNSFCWTPPGRKLSNGQLNPNFKEMPSLNVGATEGPVGTRRRIVWYEYEGRKIFLKPELTRQWDDLKDDYE